MATVIILRHPVTILIIAFTNPDNSTILKLYWKYLQALNLVRYIRENMVLDPLAELHLDNQLYIYRFYVRK